MINYFYSLTLRLNECLYIAKAKAKSHIPHVVI